MTEEEDLEWPLLLNVITFADTITVQASTYIGNFWAPAQDDNAWSMVLKPDDYGVVGRYIVDFDDAHVEDEKHPRYLHASRCVARLEKQFPRLTRHFDEENRLLIQFHPDDLLHFRMFWEMID